MRVMVTAVITVVMNAENAEHGQPAITWADYLVTPDFWNRTLQNWQSEFLQLIWQAIGLSLLFLWGSSQSREAEERIEAKVDRLLTRLIEILS